MMLRKTPLLLALFAALASGQPEQPRQRLMEQASFARISTVAVTPPAEWVQGEPGQMQLKARTCAANPDLKGLRRRIVDIAVQEWAWFGFNVDDLHGQTPPAPSRNGNQNNQNNNARRFPALDPAEVAQVADTIGGYWAAIPDAAWIWARQNEAWQQSGLAARWRDPWSAAFISWVMCESGTGGQQQFERAIAHHSYIDQAIRARDSENSAALFVAYQPGEQQINPGDLLCSGLRPMYKTLAERRNQLGVGARTHCDIVVEVSEPAQQILTIGGNVRASVRMKVFPAAAGNGGQLAPLPTSRYIFAHLKLRTDTITDDAVRNSPTLQALGCTQSAAPASFSTAKLELPASSC
jgi:hypothetical protein